MSKYALVRNAALAAILGASMTFWVYPAQATVLSGQTLAASSRPVATKQAETPGATEIDPVSDQELSQFASAVNQLQAIQNEYRQQVLVVVETEGLTPERFDEILTTLRSPEAPETETIPEVTNDEAASFERAITQINQLQENTRSQMRQAIQEEGLEVERFQEIAMAVNSDQDLEARLRQMIESQAPGQS